MSRGKEVAPAPTPKKPPKSFLKKVVQWKATNKSTCSFRIPANVYPDLLPLKKQQVIQTTIKK